MIGGFFLLLACDLLGEALRDLMHLPIPGPVVGMLLLAVCLTLRSHRSGRELPPQLEHSAEALIANMGLLFVPAGVGVITQTSVLESEWLPILAGLIGSTLLGLIATALTMRLVLRKPKPDPRHPLDGGRR